MQEELLQFKMQKVWVLVDLPKGKRAIGSKWVFRNKKDERGIVIRNKARLVAQGHTKEEGLDYEEVFALVARIEAIRLFLAYASFMGFMVYQMDFKSAFLYGTIKEEVYVCQPPGFEDPDYPDKVYKMVKALCGLHQAPRAWYETLDNYLLENRFQREMIVQTLFIKKQKGDILLVQVYVDDIIFGSTNKELCKAFEKLMKDKFQMSSIGELIFFLGLQMVNQLALLLILKSLYSRILMTVVATSSTKAEYVAAVLKHYGFKISCWTIGHKTYISIKKSNDVVRLQALIDRKKVIITEDTIRQALHLDDAVGVDCLSNEETFTELARMGYEKPSTKLTSYKAFFSAQWKFLIHTILQCMSAKRTAWNEFSSSMASAVIYLATVDDLSSHNTKYTSPTPTQKVFANIRRIGKGFLGVDTPLFDGMLVQQQIHDVEDAAEDEDDDNEVSVEPTPPSPTPTNADEDVTLVDAEKDMNADVQGRLAESQAKVVTTAAATITVAQVPKASALRRRRGVVIQDLEETATASVIVHTKTLEAVANINWDDVMEQVKRIEKQDNTVMRYQALKRKHVPESQARKNMMIYLKSMVGFKMDFFKGMTYNDIRPIFEKHYNSIKAFLKKGEKEIKEEGNKRKGENLNQDKAKKQRIDEEEEELKAHLQIIVNDDDDVFSEATPLESKVPVVDY
nr:putative ribonuclease H-like domain-containing protein [Tanacetum cinerariifolium]